MKMPPPPRSNALRHHPLALCLGTACVAATPFQAGIAAILPVTSCADDGSPGTLRSVIDSAVDGDVVDLTQLTCSTITLTQGTIGTDFLSDHPVNYLTIQGPGRDALTISGGGQFLVFSAGGYNIYGVFTLNDITVAHGVNVNTASPWYESGSCIFAVRGSVTLDRVTVTDCHSTFLGGVGGGGAVDVDGVLKIIDSTISDSSVDAVGGNTAQGGGAWVGGRMEVVRSTITGNRVSAPLAADGYHGFQKTGGGGVYSAGDVIVTDSDHAEPIGILTDRDIVVGLIAMGISPDGVTVGDVMTPSLVTIREDQGVYEAIQVMERYGVKRLPVMDRNDRLIGIVSASDLMELLGREMVALSRLTERQKTREREIRL